MDFHGEAQSYHEIKFNWSVQQPVSGHLKPYRLTCIDSDGHSTAPIRTTKTIAVVRNLLRNKMYMCTLKASTIAENGQNPKECEVSLEAPPIKTLDIGAS